MPGGSRYRRDRGSIAVGEQAAAILISCSVRSAERGVRKAVDNSRANRSAALSPDPELAGTLSSLARLDAAGPQPGSARLAWWAAEAASCERAGLSRGSAEAHHALAKLLGQLDSIDTSVTSRTSRPGGSGCRRYHRGDEPAAATRLREAIGGRSGRAPLRRQRPNSTWPPRSKALRRTGAPSGLQWMLDPDLMPKGSSDSGSRPTRTCRYGRGRGGTGSGRGSASTGRGLRRTQPLPGSAGGPRSSPCPGQAAVRRPHRTVSGQTAAPFPLGRTTGELDRGSAGQAVAGPQCQRTPDQACLRWATRPSRRTRPGRTGPHSAHEEWTAWPPWPGTCRRDWKRPATTIAPPGRRRQAVRSRRSTVLPTWPRPSAVKQ